MSELMAHVITGRTYKDAGAVMSARLKDGMVSFKRASTPAEAANVIASDFVPALDLFLASCAKVDALVDAKIASGEWQSTNMLLALRAELDKYRQGRDALCALDKRVREGSIADVTISVMQALSILVGETPPAEQLDEAAVFDELRNQVDPGSIGEMFTALRYQETGKQLDRRINDAQIPFAEAKTSDAVADVIAKHIVPAMNELIVTSERVDAAVDAKAAAGEAAVTQAVRDLRAKVSRFRGARDALSAIEPRARGGELSYEDAKAAFVKVMTIDPS